MKFDKIKGLLDNFIGNSNYTITDNDKIMIKCAIKDLDVYINFLQLVKEVNPDSSMIGSWRTGTYAKKGYWLIVDTAPNGGFKNIDTIKAQDNTVKLKENVFF